MQAELSEAQQRLVDETLRRLSPQQALLELRKRAQGNSTVPVPSYAYLRNRKRYLTQEGNSDLELLLNNPAVYTLMLKVRGQEGVVVLLLLEQNVKKIVEENIHRTIFVDGTW